MKKVSSIIISILAVFAIGFTACSSDDNNNDTPNGTEEIVPGNNHKVLIAYFSEPLPDGVDASTSASRLVINDNVVGSVEYLAQLIRQNTGGDMVRIQTATPYPGNFDDLADQAKPRASEQCTSSVVNQYRGFRQLRRGVRGLSHLVVSDADGDVLVLRQI